MSIWMEIHCDERQEGRDPKDILKPFCYSYEAPQIAQMSGNKTDAVQFCLRDMRKEARKAGWRYSKGKWACPNCKTVKTQETDQ